MDPDLAAHGLRGGCAVQIASTERPPKLGYLLFAALAGLIAWRKLRRPPQAK